jgi:cobalt/nickel transport system permease protein
MVILTCVISIQALIFQDGGLLVLGTNIFNMAIVAVTVSYMVYHTVRWLAGSRSAGVYASGFIAAWTSVVVAALGTAMELAVSGTSPANIAIPTMGGIHALIGIGEGLITVGALAFLHARRQAGMGGRAGAGASAGDRFPAGLQTSGWPDKRS